MSLIERAVDRLAKAAPEEHSAPATPEQPPTASEAKVSTIETFMNRVGTPGVASKAEPAPVADHQRGAAELPVPDRAPAAVDRQGPEPLRIHLERLRVRGLVTPDGQRSQINDEFRLIKRPLLVNAFGRAGQPPAKHGKRVMVTSSFPGEGKSFCAINLAMSIAAERDHQVILVDADVARPSLPQELGFNADAGMMDWLVDGKPDLAQLVRPTNIDKLWLLPSGRRHEQATELLASGAMTRLLEEISTRFPECIVIFDSPPVLVTTESRVLASHMGQIVMVVEAGKTPREAVTESLNAVDSCEIVGLVLNKARKIDAGGYYGSGYGYGRVGTA